MLNTHIYHFLPVSVFVTLFGRLKCKAVHYCTWFSALKVLKTICSSVQPCTLEDGQNGARIMLSYWFINIS